MLEVEFLGKKFRNPFVVASGFVIVNAKLMASYIKVGAAAVTMKSVCVEAQKGHPNPIIHQDEHFFLNAVGLAGPGAQAAVEEVKKFKELSEGILIGSIFGRTVEEFSQAAEIISQAPLDFLEINISCPNAKHLYTTPFAFNTKLATKITQAVKNCASVPIIVKLSPAVWNIADFAKAVEAAGADAITATNTMPGMKINIKSRKPVLSNMTGGVSGYALKPIAVKSVWEIYKAVKIPIIGTGGIMTGEDAVEMLLAGARLLGVGTVIYYHGKNAIRDIMDKVEKIMQEQKWQSVEEIIGLSHKL